MKDSAQDSPAMRHIEKLVAEEHRLFEQKSRSDEDERHLKQIQVQLDQCWDLLRQRRALRSAGRDPADADVRPPEVVERYEQ